MARIGSFTESLQGWGVGPLDISNLSLDLKGQEMPFSVLEEETKIDCLQPKGVSYSRIVFHGTGHKCLFSRGRGLNMFPLGIQIVCA